MKALQLIQPHHFIIKELPIPNLEAKQALVCFKYGLLCGSDYPKYANEWPGSSLPLLPGMPLHECVGQVEESQIPNLPSKTWVLAMPEKDCGLADFFVVSLNNMIPLIGWESEDLPFAALGQPTGTVLYSLERLGNVSNQTVLVFGLGGIGFIFCILLSKMGVKEIIGIEPNSFRRKLANELFDVKVFPEWSNRFENIADVSIDAVGQSEQSKIISASFISTHPHGRVVLFGVPTIPEQKISVYSIIRKNLTLIGTSNPDWAIYLPRGIQVVKRDIDLFKPLITHHFHWKQAQKAFDLFGQRDGNRIKILLHE